MIPRILLAIAVAASVCGSALASGARFDISAADQKLSPPVQDSEIPVYHVKLTVGQEVTLVAQGVAIPRGQTGKPFAASAAAWLFDDEAFQIMPHNKKLFDWTQTAVTLKGLKAGKTRVRFVGNILGYNQKYDVMVEVEAK